MNPSCNTSLLSLPTTSTSAPPFSCSAGDAKLPAGHGYEGKRRQPPRFHGLTGSFPNNVNLKSKGNVPVAILSGSTFYATNADLNTVIFAGVAPLSIGKSVVEVDFGNTSVGGTNRG